MMSKREAATWYRYPTNVYLLVLMVMERLKIVGMRSRARATVKSAEVTHWLTYNRGSMR